QYPVKFGLQITRMYHRLCHTACGKPEAHKGRRWEPVDVLFNEKHWADFWDALFFRLTRAVSWFLGDGSRELVATKQETLNDDDLEANIKDPKQKPSSARRQLAQPVMAPEAESPALHRVKGKQSPDAKDELIRKLYAEVEALKLRTPSTASSAKPRKPKSADPKTTPQTEAAKENRLRRLCEQKPSGRINVPKEVHDRWAQGGEVRKTLLAELEAADWDKDSFLSRVTKTSEKRNQTSAHKKRGWYTMEGMATILKWSKHIGS
ncbi:unnamed protein product, partial [Symbiodinium microadriaticum]